MISRSMTASSSPSAGTVSMWSASPELGDTRTDTLYSISILAFFWRPGPRTPPPPGNPRLVSFDPEPVRFRFDPVRFRRGSRAGATQIAHGIRREPARAAGAPPGHKPFTAVRPRTQRLSPRREVVRAHARDLWAGMAVVAGTGWCPEQVCASHARCHAKERLRGAASPRAANIDTKNKLKCDNVICAGGAHRTRNPVFRVFTRGEKRTL